MALQSWKRKFVGYVEAIRETEKCLELRVKIPRPVADAVSTETEKSGLHRMVYYADAFAMGLSDALTTEQGPASIDEELQQARNRGH